MSMVFRENRNQRRVGRFIFMAARILAGSFRWNSSFRPIDFFCSFFLDKQRAERRDWHLPRQSRFFYARSLQCRASDSVLGTDDAGWIQALRYQARIMQRQSKPTATSPRFIGLHLRISRWIAELVFF